MIVTRLLGVAQGFVNRRLQDEAGLRVAAMREGCAFLDVRMRLLEFLDAAPDTVTAADCAEFVCSRISVWQIDVETRTMRIQLRS